jgi:archaellum component FlaC
MAKIDIQLLIIYFPALFALYKGVIAWRIEGTKQKQIEESEKTARAEHEAKENSLGADLARMLRADIVLLKNEIIELQKYKGENNLKIERLESIIKQMEMTYEFIEKRMLNMFPDKK